MSIGVRVSGAWKDVNATYVKVGGVWKTVSQAYVKVGGVWKELLATRGPSSLIDRTAGTIIGDMTASGGMAAAFDGITNQQNSQSAARSGNDGFVGKTFAVPTAIDFFTCYGTSTGGFISGGTMVTLTIYGKQGTAPASTTDGSAIGSLTFANAVSQVQPLDCTDKSTYWDHAWIRVQNVDGTNAVRMAELEMTGWQ